MVEKQKKATESLDPSVWVTVREATRIMGCTRGWVYQLAKRGSIRYRRAFGPRDAGVAPR